MWRGVHCVLLNKAEVVAPEVTGAVMAAVIVEDEDVEDATVVTT